jgi:PAS domain S-box-containing protein
MTRTGLIATCFVGLLIAGTGRAHGVDSNRHISQYAHTAWKAREGFPRGVISSIAQTPDGYLWLGTEFGLLRFDGVRTAPWQPPAGEKLPSNFISGLLVAHDGTLWIGTLNGLVSYKDGKLRQHREVAGAYVGVFLEDREQTVWFEARRAANGRLCAIRKGNVECYGSGTFGTFVFPLYEDHKGNIWVTSAMGLWRWASGPPTRYELPRGVEFVTALADDDSGRLLVGTSDGLKQLVNGKIENDTVRGITGHFTPNVNPNAFLRSHDDLWIGTTEGLVRLHQGSVDRFSAVDGLSGDFVNGMFEDREGSVWVATREGLDRFREYTVPTISRSQGLSDSPISIQATRDGSIWVATEEALDRWANGHVTVYRGQTALVQTHRSDEAKLDITGAATEVANSGFMGSPRSLGLDDEGRLWDSTDYGVFYFERGRFVRVRGIPGGEHIFSLSGDGHGGVWILAEKDLFQWFPNAAVRHIPWHQFGQRTGRAMLPDREAGGLWVGFSEGGLVYVKDGKIVRSYDAASGFGGRVNHLRFGPNGGVWASTENGLSRIKDGQVSTMTQKNGLPCDEVHWSVEDEDHAVWLYMPCGLVRVGRSELDAWIDDPKHVLKTTLFDNSDGVWSVGVYGPFGPHVTKSPDGRIWFVPEDGVSVIDPRHLPFNKLPPPVHVDQITADRKTYNPASYTNGRMPLPARIRDLEIDYTALSLVAPEKVRFRYKLEGRDRDWQDVGNRRQAYYNDLPPGNYRFRVIASNNSGVWNETGAALDFKVAAAWFQTIWFRALCVVAFVGLLGSLYWIRLLRMQRQFKVILETQLNERTRIINTIPALAWSTRPDGAAEFFNQRWLDYTGLASEQAEGWGWKVAIHPDDLDRMLSYWCAAIATGEPAEIEGRLRRSDGEFRWFLFRANAVRDESGAIVKWYGTNTDIDDRKRAEERVRRSEAFLVEGQGLSRTGTYSWRPDTGEIS